MSYLRSALYLLVLTVTVIPWAFVVLAAYVRPLAVRYRLCTMWTRFAILAARRICGIAWRVEGWENLPAAPSILLPKHQSTWETFWLPSFLPHPLTFVYKRELHMVPFFGWALASLHMINIDRGRGQDAFEQVVTQGEQHLRDGWWIVIFPEGTRTPPGSTKRYKTGGPRLAVRTGAYALPIAVNSGECWPKNGLLRPGVITVSIGKPIDPKGKSAEEVGALVESWIENEMRRLAPHRYSGPYQPATRGGTVPAPQD